MWQDLTLNFFSLENTLLAWWGRTTPVFRSRGYGHLSTSTDLIEKHSTQYDRLEIGHKSAKYLGNVYLRGNIQSSYYVGIRVVKMKLICAIIEHSDIISGFSSTSHLLKEKQKQKSCNATTFPHENTTVPGKHFYYFVIPGVFFFSECIYIAGNCRIKYESLMISPDVERIWNWWGIKQAAESICLTNIVLAGTPGKHLMKFPV